MPSPQYSVLQSALQPSPSIRFASSHSSVPTLMPSAHISWQTDGSPLHCHPGSTVHVTEHPSPGVVPSSSHSSPLSASIAPLLQVVVTVLVVVLVVVVVVELHVARILLKTASARCLQSTKAATSHATATIGAAITPNGGKDTNVSPPSSRQREVPTSSAQTT